VWIIEILRWTVGYGKVPGTHLPDWVSVAWMLCLLGSPAVSVLLGVLIAVDRRERFSGGFFVAFLYGCSPVFLLLAYGAVLGG
jgi:hypothetical protein